MSKISVNKDIEKAKLISPLFYTQDKYFNKVKDKIFKQSLQFINHIDCIKNTINPILVLEDFIDEPYLLIKNKINSNSFDYKILSNVCTHRAN